MIWRSHILSLLLAGVIVLTAQSAAVARTMPDASGQMVLCSGTGPMLVSVDENGVPMEPPQLCPDCALALFTALDAGEVTIASLGMWRRYTANAVHVSARTCRMGQPNARAPPVLFSQKRIL